MPLVTFSMANTGVIDSCFIGLLKKLGEIKTQAIFADDSQKRDQFFYKEGLRLNFSKNHLTLQSLGHLSKLMRVFHGFYSLNIENQIFKASSKALPLVQNSELILLFLAKSLKAQ